MNHNRELIWSLLTSLKWNQPHDRLYFTLLAELAHNLFSLRAQKLTFPPEDWLATESDWPLWARAFILHCYIIKKSYLSCKENFTCFDGSFLMVRIPWHIVCIKRREKKQAIKEGKCISTAITYILTSKSLLFEWEAVEWIFIFHVPCDRFKRIFYCWNNKNRSDDIF